MFSNILNNSETTDTVFSVLYFEELVAMKKYHLYTLNHFTSAFARDTSHSKVAFSFSGVVTSSNGLRIFAGGSAKYKIKLYNRIHRKIL